MGVTLSQTVRNGPELDPFPFISPHSNIFETPGLGLSSGFLWIADRAYWGYLGFCVGKITLNYLRTVLTVNAAGSVAVEFGIFYGSGPPTYGSNITMNKIAATGSVDSLTSGAAKTVANSSALGAVCTPGQYIYWGVRANYGTTQPTTNAVFRDQGAGRLLSTSTAGVLTGAGPWTAVPIAFVAEATLQAPRIIVTTA